MTSGPSRLRPLTDVSAADWVVESVGGLGSGVRWLLPSCFDSYARILHPAWPASEVSAKERGRAPVRWADVAATTGRTMHSRVQFDALVGVEGGKPRPYEPDVGCLPPDLLAALCEVLAQHTAAPEHCWFCLWEGWGWIGGSPSVRLLQAHPAEAVEVPAAIPPEILAGPRVSIPGRGYILFEGPLAAATDLGWRSGELLSAAYPERDFDPGEFQPQSPSLFWPDDRAWCVATEIDLDSTYLSGSQRLVDALLEDPRFEAWPAQLDDRVDSGADEVNR